MKWLEDEDIAEIVASMTRIEGKRKYVASMVRQQARVLRMHCITFLIPDHVEFELSLSQITVVCAHVVCVGWCRMVGFAAALSKIPGEQQAE